MPALSKCCYTPMHDGKTCSKCGGSMMSECPEEKKSHVPAEAADPEWLPQRKKEIEEVLDLVGYSVMDRDHIQIDKELLKKELACYVAEVHDDAFVRGLAKGREEVASRRLVEGNKLTEIIWQHDNSTVKCMSYEQCRRLSVAILQAIEEGERP